MAQNMCWKIPTVQLTTESQMIKLNDKIFIP